MSILEELSPLFVGAAAITLSLNDPNVVIRAFDIVKVDVDYTATEPEKTTLPLELLVVAPTPENFRRTIFRRVRPTELFFKPVEGGTHTLVLREVGHNNWRGALEVEVQGDATTPV